MKKLFCFPVIGFHLFLEQTVTQICPVPSSLNLVTSDSMSPSHLPAPASFSYYDGFQIAFFPFLLQHVFIFPPQIRQPFPHYESIRRLVHLQLHLPTETRNELTVPCLG